MADIDYQKLEFQCQPARSPVERHDGVVVVGAGPVGLSMSLDLAQRGHHVVLIDDDCRLSSGSRAICFAKRTLDIWDRLGVGEAMVRKGVSWSVGRIFFRDDEVWRFDLLPEHNHRRPAFINLQQYYCEGFLYEHAVQHPNIDLRWKHKATKLEEHGDHAVLTVDTPDGAYTLDARWVIACDGARSPVRKMMGLETHGRVFRDRFLIADVKMHADFPIERWFWFDPPFHRNQSVLLHSQPDNVWRIDFQLGWDADPVEEVKPERVIPRIQALLGKDAQFQLEWVSVYTFACERMDHFRHGRVLFAGDAAHRVSPFGARGANSGVQDVDNLGWKLDLVMRGLAPDTLMDTYAQERELAADENVLNSTRSTDFITPKSEISLLFRNTVLRLAKNHDFARKLVNSGRLSTPTFYTQSTLNTPDTDDFAQAPPLGAVAPDAPVTVDGQPAWWLEQLDGRFVVVFFCQDALPSSALLQDLGALHDSPLGVRVVLVLHAVLADDVSTRSEAEALSQATGLSVVADTDSVLAARYGIQADSCYLIRPDQHIAARWRHADLPTIQAALRRATGSHAEINPCPL